MTMSTNHRGWLFVVAFTTFLVFHVDGFHLANNTAVTFQYSVSLAAASNVVSPLATIHLRSLRFATTAASGRWSVVADFAADDGDGNSTTTTTDTLLQRLVDTVLDASSTEKDAKTSSGSTSANAVQQLSLATSYGVHLCFGRDGSDGVQRGDSAMQTHSSDGHAAPSAKAGATVAVTDFDAASSNDTSTAIGSTKRDGRGEGVQRGDSAKQTSPTKAVSDTTSSDDASAARSSATRDAALNAVSDDSPASASASGACFASHAPLCDLLAGCLRHHVLIVTDAELRVVGVRVLTPPPAVPAGPAAGSGCLPALPAACARDPERRLSLALQTPDAGPHPLNHEYVAFVDEQERLAREAEANRSFLGGYWMYFATFTFIMLIIMTTGDPETFMYY